MREMIVEAMIIFLVSGPWSSPASLASCSGGIELIASIVRVQTVVRVMRRVGTTAHRDPVARPKPTFNESDVLVLPWPVQ
jgi:hypothetical protein